MRIGSGNGVFWVATLMALAGCSQEDPPPPDAFGGPAAGNPGVAAAPAAGADGSAGAAGLAAAGMSAMAGAGQPVAGAASAAGAPTAGAAGAPTAGAAGAPAAGMEAIAGSAAAAAAPPEPDYYPLEEGAEWAYRHTGGTVPWTEVVTVSAIQHLGQPAFEMRDTPGPSGVRSVQVLVRDGGLTLRVHAEELTDNSTSAIVNYDPGFARFDAAWLAMSAGDSLTLDYQRVEHDATGALVSDELRSHRYDMLAMAQTVTVPAGTFEDCFQVKRSRMPAPGAMQMPGDIETFWFCPGVGKVKEIEDLSGKVEELERCNLAACTQ